MSWKDCIEENKARRITPDVLKAKSLSETALERISLFSEMKLSESNVNYVFEAYYTSILEIIHSIALLKGFKMENHICAGYFLKECLKQEKLYILFDDCRYKRNSLVYYGKRMKLEVAETTIQAAKSLIKELKSIK